MPTTTGLTEKQSSFVALYVANGAQGTLAAKGAGYADWEHEGTRLVALPHIRQAIRAALESAIHTEGAQLAWGLVKEALTNTEWPKHLRLDAAKFTLKAGGYEANTALPQADKPLSDMSVTELEEFVSRGHAALDAIKPASAHVIDIPTASA
jgi:hypothetical protein